MSLQELRRGRRFIIELRYVTVTLRLAPFGGRFLVHGGTVAVLEGTWMGHVITIESPGLDTARARRQAILR